MEFTPQDLVIGIVAFSIVIALGYVGYNMFIEDKYIVRARIHLPPYRTEFARKADFVINGFVYGMTLLGCLLTMTPYPAFPGMLLGFAIALLIRGIEKLCVDIIPRRSSVG